MNQNAIPLIARKRMPSSANYSRIDCPMLADWIVLQVAQIV